VKAAAASLVLMAAATGCAQATLEPAPPEMAGTYLLQTVDGAVLPAPVTGGTLAAQFTIAADTRLITPSGAFGQWSVPTTGIPVLGITGSALVRSDSLFLVENVLGSVAAKGRVSHDTVWLRSLGSHQFPGHNWVYLKAS
jgi:hypothetical protein